MNVSRKKIGVVLLMFTLVFVNFVGCSKKEEKKVVTVSDKQDAETLALAGEQLVSPYTFMLADKAFNAALEKDPTNERALFLKSLIKRFMVFKGIAVRARPVLRVHGGIDQLEKEMRTFPNSPLKNFLMDGKEDIKDAQGVQDVLVNYRNAVNDFRIFLKKHKDMEITLNLNPHVFEKEIQKDMAEKCQVLEYAGEADFKVECDYRTIAQRKVSPADLLILRQEAGGEILYLSLFTSYSVKGLDHIVEIDPNGRLKGQALQQELEALPEFGKLRKDESLSLLPELGADFKAAYQWALANQSRLCPNGVENAKDEWGRTIENRPGYLFPLGVCVEYKNDAQRTIALLGQILQGPIRTDVESNKGIMEVTTVDVLAIARNPIKDLRSIAPASYNECGEATSLRDKTLGGMYPEKNAENFVELGPTNGLCN